jgi:poly-gamma-glutamate capsule biosynthesis protein CapA/YwtB (metallophosphatase superfamily)
MPRLKYIFTILIAIIFGLLLAEGFVYSFNFLNKNISSKKEDIPKTLLINSEIKKATIPEISKTITITFVGDMMFDRHIRNWAMKNSYENIFKNVKEKLQASDLVIGNLEGPITNFESIYKDGNILNNYTFTFDPQVASILKEANIGIVSLDNNHIFNFGREGLKQTVENLDKVGINYFGNPDDRSILYKEISGIKLAFLSYNQFVETDIEKLLADIKIADQNSDQVIVFSHWGNEYEYTPTEYDISLAHSFVDSGADLVIGAHPHVIQTKEIYQGKYIYYSLGNFVFDQYFNNEVKCGLVLSFDLSQDGVVSIKEEFISLSINNIVQFSPCFKGF